MGAPEEETSNLNANETTANIGSTTVKSETKIYLSVLCKSLFPSEVVYCH